MSEQLASSSPSLAFRQFVETCRSPATRQGYVKALRYFANYLRLSPNSYDELLDKDPQHIQMDICDFITYLRKKGNASATVSMYIASLHKFYTMNDVTTLNWKKIKSFEAERERHIEDRPYTRSEIHTLVTNASLRDRAMILLMCSTGIRRGGIASLRLRDLESNEKYNLFRLTVYSKSVKHRYFTFCSPECRKSIEDYMEYRRRSGERLDDTAPLFRADYNAQHIRSIRPITARAITRTIDVLLRNVGMREPALEGKPKRHEIMMTHGFRKFFETNAYKAGMDHMYLRRLIGQKSGLEDAYLKLSEEELLEGDSKHVGYVGIIDQLTINEEHRLKRKVEELTIKVDEIHDLRDEFAAFKQKMGLQ